MISLHEFIKESINSDDKWKAYISNNREELIKGMSEYYGKIKNITFRNTFTSKDGIKGVKITYSTKDGKTNQDAYISDDGYVIDFTKEPMKSNYSKNKFQHILPNIKL